MKPNTWNLSIYLAADNNLQEECIFELGEILALGKIPQIKTVVQFDAGTAITRYNFEKVNLAEKPINSLDDLAERVPFDANELNEIPDSTLIADFFVKETGEAYNFAVLSGHGSGAVGDFLTTDNPPNALSIPTMNNVFDPVTQKTGEKYDILGMDSCLMSMVEVYFQLAPYAKILIGAEGFEENTGWPYHKILRLLKEKPDLKPRELALLSVREYMNFYKPYYAAGVSVDLSACDLSDDNIKTLKAAINNLAMTLKENLDMPQLLQAIVLARWEAQGYKFEQYVDLWDFCGQLKKQLEAGTFNATELSQANQILENVDLLRETADGWNAVKKSIQKWEHVRSAAMSACSSVMTAIDQMVLISCYSGATFQHSHGLSIYFPWSKAELEKNLGYYQMLAFARATEWDEFLLAFALKTQREVRDDNNLRAEKIAPRGMVPTGFVSSALASPAETRTAPPVEKKTAPPVEKRTAPPVEKRGILRFIPDIKNSPTEFFMEDFDQKVREKLSALEKIKQPPEEK